MGKTSAFTALVIPKRRGVGFYAGQTLNTKMFAGNLLLRNECASDEISGGRGVLSASKNVQHCG